MTERARPVMPRFNDYVNDGLVFDVLDSGPISGPAVILLHGFPERASHWDAVATELHKCGYRTLAPDQRGYSPGARPKLRSSYRMDNLVGDVHALASRLGRSVHLVGHDWGAAVAWTMAARFPLAVRTLTTVSVPHPEAFTRSLFTSTQALRSWYVLAAQPPGLVEAAVRFAPGVLEAMLRRAGLRSDDVQRFRTEIVEYGALPGALGWYRAVPFNAWQRTEPVRVPTTHVWSDGDRALSRRGAELTSNYVDAPYELCELTGVGHCVPTEAPEALAAAIIARMRTDERRSP